MLASNIIRQEIGMKNNTTRAILVACLAIILVICSFGGGFAAGHFLPIGNRVDQAASTSEAPEDLNELFAPFWEAWKIAHDEYVDQPLDDTTLMQGAIRGMMDSLGDPHSAYMSPQEYKDATTQLAGNYAGIGSLVDTSGELLTITRPFPDSPAEKAGLQAGDQVIAVDGLDVTGLQPEAVRQKVLGREGTKVRLTIQRPDQEQPFDVQITRAVIIVPSVTSKMLDNDIAYIELTMFGDETADDLHQQLADLLDRNPRGLILDLRYNGGGYLESGILVASEFISSGVIVSEKSSDGSVTPHPAIQGGLATDSNLPMIVLVNEYSASASEIVAGALQDTGRARLLGVTTYGKGTVQNWVALSEDQGAVAVTIARWLTPNGNSIDKKGLTPDIVVEMTDEDIEAKLDPQLDAAVQQLSN
jgi:carboxyl-terminal processing protease